MGVDSRGVFHGGLVNFTRNVWSGPYTRGMRRLVLPLALLVLAGCGGSPDAVPAPTVEPESYVLTVTVIDGGRLDVSAPTSDGGCRPSAVLSPSEDARTPAFTVEDAAGTTVATGEITISGTWADEACTLTTELGEVAGSEFYTVRLAGDHGRVSPEPFEFETTVRADPVDGAVSVKWDL